MFVTAVCHKQRKQTGYPRQQNRHFPTRKVERQPVCGAIQVHNTPYAKDDRGNMHKCFMAHT